MFLSGAAAIASIAATSSLRNSPPGQEPRDSVLEGAHGVRVQVRPYGLSHEEVTQLQAELAATVLRPFLPGRYRWLSFRRDPTRRTTIMPAAPDVLTATVYDYEHGRALDVVGSLDDIGGVQVANSTRQPLPIEEEFQEAVEILKGHATLGRPIKRGHLQPYRPMPPLLPGTAGRVVSVGLFEPDPTLDRTRRHTLVGVDLSTSRVVVEHQLHGGSDCEAPSPEHTCPDNGRTGQAEVTVTRHGEELWRLVVVRPYESSGTNGSGVELRHVTYRGRSVLHRAHVPILNVDYGTPNVQRCGPTYRDWLYDESCFHADGDDVADGVRLCVDRPTTIMRSGSDSGNFRGAAIHVEDGDVVITSELRAGWYRYVTEWRLHDDGNITPRFGFSAVRNPCTCLHHVHHAYWRFDVAVDELGDHRVEEHNQDGSTSRSAWDRLEQEASRDRDPGTHRYWRISNRTTGATLVMEPGRDDARADLYGAGDTWFLRYHPDEIDDGQGFTVVPALSRSRLDLFVNAEHIEGRDVVAWYAGHWHHEHGDDGDWVGPRLRLRFP